MCFFTTWHLLSPDVHTQHQFIIIKAHEFIISLGTLKVKFSKEKTVLLVKHHFVKDVCNDCYERTRLDNIKYHIFILLSIFKTTIKQKNVSSPANHADKKLVSFVFGFWFFTCIHNSVLTCIITKKGGIILWSHYYLTQHLCFTEVNLNMIFLVKGGKLITFENSFIKIKLIIHLFAQNK